MAGTDVTIALVRRRDLVRDGWQGLMRLSRIVIRRFDPSLAPDPVKSSSSKGTRMTLFTEDTSSLADHGEYDSAKLGNSGGRHRGCKHRHPKTQ